MCDMPSKNSSAFIDAKRSFAHKEDEKGVVQQSIFEKRTVERKGEQLYLGKAGKASWRK